MQGNHKNVIQENKWILNKFKYHIKYKLIITIKYIKLSMSNSDFMYKTKRKKKINLQVSSNVLWGVRLFENIFFGDNCIYENFEMMDGCL